MSEGVPAGGPYKAAVGIHETLSIEKLRSDKRVLVNYCISNREYCSEFVKRVLEASRSIAATRLYDLSGIDYKGIDSDIIFIFNKIVDFYSRYLAGMLVTHGEDVMVEIKHDVEVDGLSLNRGNITFLNPGKAAALYLAGLVRPIASNAINLRAIEAE